MKANVPGTTLVGFSMFDLTVFYTFTVKGQDTIENYHQYKYIFTPDIKLDDDVIAWKEIVLPKERA